MPWLGQVCDLCFALKKQKNLYLPDFVLTFSQFHAYEI